MKKEAMKKDNCGNCKYWARRLGVWGYCRRHAPNPYVLGPSSEQYHLDWDKARIEAEKSESKGPKGEWPTPKNWRVIWPETTYRDYCGEWVGSEEGETERLPR